jgi:hypothetical protein
MALDAQRIGAAAVGAVAFGRLASNDSKFRLAVKAFWFATHWKLR